MVIRLINLLCILVSFFLILNEVNASQFIFNKNNNEKKEFQANSNDNFICMKSSRKYISGQKNFVIKFGNFKINFLNLDGYRKVEKFKCIFK
tara:strand:+ start:95 stop:370 length:276 start_codon:yes stop_codon:yes gene_type:complete